MQSSPEKSTSEIPLEIIRFVFPKSPELALYALATLQSFVEHYYKAIERLRIWHEYPELQRRLHVYVHCEQQFYTTFIDSFPECAEFVLPGDKLVTDELCVVLHEKVLDQFDLASGYSVQWAMGQLAGTKPQLVPTIKAPVTESVAYVHHHYRVDMPNVQYIATEAVDRSCMLAYSIASQASVVVAPQGLLTVLAVSMGKAVIEVTKTATHRPFNGARNYVQVSMLTPDKFFQNSLQRGVKWLHKKITSPLPVSSAEIPSASSQPPSESAVQPAKSA